MGKFQYEHSGIKTKGFFNIYQAKNGAIMIVMGTSFVSLTKNQIDKLSIDCHSLDDFDIDLYKEYYIENRTTNQKGE